MRSGDKPVDKRKTISNDMLEVASLISLCYNCIIKSVRG